MSTVLLAVSLSDTIQRLGSYAGLAAVVGLGVLSLLYFAQAREVKRLREWAGRAPERAAEHEQRVQADAQRRVVAQPLSPTTTAAKQAAAAAALYAKVPPPPPPPAPLVGPPGQLARPAAPAAGTVPASPGPSAVTAPASTSAPGAASPAAPAQGAGATAAIPPAATAAAAARQASSPSPAALGNGSGGQETHESDAARPDPPADPPAPLSVAPPVDDDGGFSRARYGAIIGGGVAVVAIAGVLVFALTRGHDTTTKPNDFGSVAQPSASPAAGGSSTNGTAGSAASVNRRATRVAVLNGTQQTGLARSVADQIQKAKFTVGSVGNNADQQVPTTTVAYRDGNEHAAQIVAQAIGIDRGSVQAVDANTAAAADADVVVIVGTDKTE